MSYYKTTKAQQKNRDRIMAWLNGQPFKENSRDRDPQVPDLSTMRVMEGRHYIGYDISRQFMEYNRSIADELREETGMNITLHEANSEVMGYTVDRIGDFTITSPPYWNLEFYGDEPEQLGYKKSYPEFLDGLQKVAHQNFRVLRPGAFCVWIVNDFRKGQFYSFHTDTLDLLRKAGFMQHDIMIIDYGSPIRAAFATQLIDTLILPKQHEYALSDEKEG